MSKEITRKLTEEEQKAFRIVRQRLKIRVQVKRDITIFMSAITLSLAMIVLYSILADITIFPNLPVIFIIPIMLLGALLIGVVLVGLQEILVGRRWRKQYGDIEK